MTAALIVFGVVVGVYGVAGLAVLAAERSAQAHDDAAFGRPVAEDRRRPPETVPLDRKLAQRESRTVQSLMNGNADRAAYQTEMAAIATKENLEHPLDVPKLRR